MQIQVRDLAKSFGIHTIFQNVSFFIGAGDKIGLVGRNGVGKTTLVNCIVGNCEYDIGTIKIDRSVNIGYVQQSAQLAEGTLWEAFLSSCPEILAMRRKIQELEQDISATDEEQRLADLLKEHSDLIAKYEHADGYGYEQRIKKVSYGLGFYEADWQKSVDNFSGGQKTRIILASALVREPDVLILDEPTNHLDISMVEWLESFLRDYKGGVLLISHDRYFLDKVTNKILELENQKLSSFKGNYSSYHEQKELLHKSAVLAYEKQQEHIEKTEEYIRRYKAGIKSKQARGRQSQLNRLERLDIPYSGKSLHLKLPPATMSGEKVLVLDEMSLGYSKENVLVERASLLIRRQEKVAIVGKNGVGKTTLLKTILQELNPLQGRVSLGSRVKVGYFAQQHDNLNVANTLIDELMSEYGFSEEVARNYLGSILFTGDSVWQKIGSLSGGEQARLALLKLVLSGANFLVLDEPTNHLDIVAREVVEDLLLTFDGTLLVVSHDRYFLNKIANRIWDIENKTITDYMGTFAFYQEKKVPLIEAVLASTSFPSGTERSNSVSVVKNNIPVRKRNLSVADLQKKLDSTELSIREQEALLKILEQKLSDPASHADLELSKELAAEHLALENKLSKLLLDWEQIMADLESSAEE